MCCCCLWSWIRIKFFICFSSQCSKGTNSTNTFIQKGHWNLKIAAPAVSMNAVQIHEDTHTARSTKANKLIDEVMDFYSTSRFRCVSVSHITASRDVDVVLCPADMLTGRRLLTFSLVNVCLQTSANSGSVRAELMLLEIPAAQFKCDTTDALRQLLYSHVWNKIYSSSDTTHKTWVEWKLNLYHKTNTESFGLFKLKPVVILPSVYICTFHSLSLCSFRTISAVCWMGCLNRGLGFYEA